MVGRDDTAQYFKKQREEFEDCKIYRKQLKYSQIPQGGHPDKTDTSIKRTPNFDPCYFFSHLLYFKSLKDGHLSRRTMDTLKFGTDS